MLRILDVDYQTLSLIAWFILVIWLIYLDGTLRTPCQQRLFNTTYQKIFRSLYAWSFSNVHNSCFSGFSELSLVYIYPELISATVTLLLD